ncbi:MAG: rod shape-determining protein MreC [Candidatus Coatesbacteria bacterium]|nr:rod shape-determining protein MreC [Candidatus Coatesbacteria bacterium]
MLRLFSILGQQKNLFLLFYLLVSVIFLFLPDATKISFATNLFRTVFYPLRRFAVIVQYLPLVKEDNTKLKTELIELKLKIDSAEKAEKENAYLRKLLGFKEKMNMRVTYARILHHSPSKNITLLVIDKGYKDGIKTGFPVINFEGLVGKVIETDYSVSYIQTLLDPGFSVSAYIERNNILCLVRGKNQVELTELPRNADLKEGDLIITSGIGETFPTGIKIGTIPKNSIPDRVELIQEIPIKPIVTFGSLQDIFIIHTDEKKE